MTVTAYPVANKPKSAEICEAFIAGCGGAVATGSPRLLSGPAFFYGVDSSNEHLWLEARADPGRVWYYADNSFFDSARGKYFRVSKNRLQHCGYGTSDGERFRALGIEMKPWREAGDHVVVCPQSDHFMRTIVGFRGDWTREIVGALKTLTSRPVVVREWQRDKGKAAKTLPADLDGAHALITWSSAAAVTAVLAGVPVVVGGDCAAAPMAGQMFKLDQLPRKDRENWAGVLADQQWTLDEFARGDAWRALQ